MTTVNRLFNVLVLVSILYATTLFIKVGGREFTKVIVTSHFRDDHPNCRLEKGEALQPDAYWEWWSTPRGQCAFFKSATTGVEIVIILAVVKGVMTLITGYVPDPDKNSWKRRSGNHF